MSRHIETESGLLDIRFTHAYNKKESMGVPCFGAPAACSRGEDEPKGVIPD